eukprot:SAG31_NODE_6751_length_1899_cov_1.296667_2_plen_266_part_00
MEDIDITVMARTSTSWNSVLDGPNSPMSPMGLSEEADRNRMAVVGRAQADFAAVKDTSVQKPQDRSRIMMQRNMLARRMVASILKGELDSVAAPRTLQQQRPDAELDENIMGDSDTIDSIINIGGADLLNAWNSVGTDDEQVIGVGNDDDVLAPAQQAHDHHGHSIWRVPKGTRSKIFWLVSFPIMLPLTYTVPDCRKHEKWFFVTFMMSIVWMGSLVTVMVTSCEALGEWSGMSVATMGLTFVVCSCASLVPSSISDTISCCVF